MRAQARSLGIDISMNSKLAEAKPSLHQESMTLQDIRTTDLAANSDPPGNQRVEPDCMVQLETNTGQVGENVQVLAETHFPNRPRSVQTTGKPKSACTHGISSQKNVLLPNNVSGNPYKTQQLSTCEQSWTFSYMPRSVFCWRKLLSIWYLCACFHQPSPNSANSPEPQKDHVSLLMLEDHSAPSIKASKVLKPETLPSTGLKTAPIDLK